MRNTSKNKILMTLATAFLLTGLASAQPRVEFLWSDHSAELFDTQTAAWESAVAMPQNAIRWKYDRHRAIENFQALYPRDRQVIQQIQVTPSGAEVSEFDDLPSITVEKIVVTPPTVENY